MKEPQPSLAKEKTLAPARIAESEYLEFRDSPIHGHGGFARIQIPAGTYMIEYLGERIPKDESQRRCELNNNYIFTLNENQDLDGDVPWNPARLINHSCSPNAEAELCDGRIWIVARRDIAPGEEVTFNYGYDLVDYKDHPCRCGASGCVGYIVAEEFFPHVRKQKRVSKEAGTKA